MKRFVVGDIHGRAAALREVLKKAKFDYEKVRLIILGDVVDGGDESKDVVEELLKIKNRVLILGNHDLWFINSYKKGIIENIWTTQGGAATIRSYKDGIPESHKKFFEEAVDYYIEDGDKLFVHGGFDVWHNKKVEETPRHFLVWDRTIIDFARKGNTIPGFKEVYIGHTTTQLYGGTTEPIKFNNLYLLDCGAGYNGRLCLMNIDTKKHYLSKI